MKRLFLPLLGIVMITLVVPRFVVAAPPENLPPFHTSDPALWINSEPLSKEDLAGKVVLLDVWTFECWNCYRSFPWLKALEASLQGEDFTVLGVHSPEFDHERQPENVAKKVAEFGLQHPVVIDNDFKYWRALRNRYWPAFYIVDKQGKIRHYFVGETHIGDEKALLAEQAIRSLLKE